MESDSEEAPSTSYGGEPYQNGTPTSDAAAGYGGTPVAGSREQMLEHTSHLFDKLAVRVGHLKSEVGRGESGSPCGSLSPNSPSMVDPGVEQCVRQSVAELELKLESVLESVTEDLAAEVSREQQHLMLMQDQVDKQGQTLLKEVSELRKKMDQEKTQRSFVQRSVRESKEQLAEQIQRQGEELKLLRARLLDLETPWALRILQRLSSTLWGACSYASDHPVSGSAAPSPSRQYQPVAELAPLASDPTEAVAMAR